MSAPAVAGALATYIARHPGISTVGAPGTLAPAAQALIQQAKPQGDHCGFTADPDGSPEPMLYVGIPDSDCGAVATPDTDNDGLPDVVETQIYASNAAVADSDGDGCRDGAEAAGEPLFGGLRDPLDRWDFFDVPTPVLSAANTTGTRNGVIGIQDVIAIVYYIGTSQGGGPNSGGVSYNSDLDGDGVADGREYDRTPSTTAGKPWRSRQPSGAVSIQDALVALQQVGTAC
jgi:hypothetical protein